MHAFREVPRHKSWKWPPHHPHPLKSHPPMLLYSPSIPLSVLNTQTSPQWRGGNKGANAWIPIPPGNSRCGNTAGYWSLWIKCNNRVIGIHTIHSKNLNWQNAVFCIWQRRWAWVARKSMKRIVKVAFFTWWLFDHSDSTLSKIWCMSSHDTAFVQTYTQYPAF